MAKRNVKILPSAPPAQPEHTDAMVAGMEEVAEPVPAPIGPTTGDEPSFEPLEVVDLPIDLLDPHPMNPNEQTPETFNTLTSTLAEDGPDQPIVVVPKGDRYTIIKGEHRWRAARVLGWRTFPCVVRHHWTDDLTQVTRLVRDNVMRGDLNKDRFTELTKAMQRDHQLDRDMLAALSGFDSPKDMYRYLHREKRDQDAVAAATEDQAKGQLRVLDDLSLMLNTIFTKYGHTIPYGFLAFMWGGQIHYMIELSAELKKPLEDAARIAMERKLDLNLLLAHMLKEMIPTYRPSWLPEDSTDAPGAVGDEGRESQPAGTGDSDSGHPARAADPEAPDVRG